MRGNPGRPGSIGPRGQQGEVGLHGQIGLCGPEGQKGIKGDIGDRGNKGDKGDRGEQGNPGFDGKQGLKGESGSHTELKGIVDGILKGDEGEQGLKGDTGLKGGDGEDGKDGKNGKDGRKGDVGPSGETGLQGITGLQGYQGEIGFTGTKGEKGNKGDIGPQGKIGPKGAKGTKGEEGKIGKDGITNIIAGGTAFMPRNKRDATTSPGVTNDEQEGYLVGSRWWDTTNDKEYVCMDKTTGSAVWIETTASAGGDPDQNLFETIAADAGTSAVADTTTDTLTISGGGGVTTTGTAATDTIEITVDHDAVDNFVANEHIDWTSTASNFNTSGTLTVSGTTADFSGATNFLLPNADAPTAPNADGEIVFDNVYADFSTGLIRVYLSGEEQGVVTMPLAQFGTPSDNYVVTYNATNDEFELQAAAGGGDVTGDSASTDKEFVRFNGVGGKTIESPVTDLATTTATLSDNADVTFYDDVNDGSPVFSYGSSATNRLTIIPAYDSGAKTLDYVEFKTYSANAGGDKGEFRFSVDETLIATIDDGGLEIKASGSLSFGAVDILTDSAGTTTLSNIDAIDDTTESTIETAIDTLSNLTSIGTIATGTWQATDVGVGYGGTGQSSFTDGGLLVGAAGSALEVTDAGTVGSATLPDEFLHAKGSGVNPDYKGIEQTVSITIETPVADDNITIRHFNVGATIQEVHAIVIGTGSDDVTFNLYMDATRTTETTKVFSTSKTLGDGTTMTRYTPDTAAIAADDIFFIDISAITGAPTELHVTIRYTTT